ncbi:MAG: VWA domain-containing protein [Candidatus Humimicrobiaceae bacterium]
MKDSTLINVILDRSGSMQRNAVETVGMFNRFLEDQKKEKGYAELSLIQFDDKYEEDYIKIPLNDCPPLVLGRTYVPRGMTALYDAIGKSIGTVGYELNNSHEDDRPDKVLFIIITDGNENMSREMDKQAIEKLIDHQKEKYNWDFIFLAAGLDAFGEGSKFGMTRSKCASFGATGQGMNSIGSTMSNYTSSYRSTGDTDMKVDDFKDEKGE